MSELAQVKAELQSVRGLLETVLQRLDQVDLAAQSESGGLSPGQELTMSELARDIQRRGSKVAMKEFRETRKKRLKQVKVRERKEC